MITAHEVSIEMGRTLTQVEEYQIYQWITDAYAIIDARTPGADEAVKDRAVRTVVARYAGQPKSGEVVQEVAVDDARTVKRFGASSSALTLDDLLGSWWALLEPGLGVDGAFSFGPA